MKHMSFLKKDTHIFSSSKTSNFSLHSTASICSVDRRYAAILLSSSHLALNLFASGKNVSVLFDTTAHDSNIVIIITIITPWVLVCLKATNLKAETMKQKCVACRVPVNK